MKCPHCGKEIDNDSVFCEHCGAKVMLESANKASATKETAPGTYGALALGIGSFILGIFIGIILGGLGIAIAHVASSNYNEFSDIYEDNQTIVNTAKIFSIIGIIEGIIGLFIIF